MELVNPSKLCLYSEGEQPAMKPNSKLPGLAKYVFSFFIVFAAFTLTAIAFLTIGPKISKPVYGADCSFSPSYLAPGNDISITYNGIDPATVIAGVILTPDNYSLGNLTQNSPATATLTVPKETPDGTYTVVAVIQGKSGGGAYFVNCTNSSSGNTLSVKLIKTCGYSFNTAPISPGSTLAVEVSGQPLDTFQGAFFDSGNNASGADQRSMPSSGPLKLSLTAPSTEGQYKVLVVNKTQGFSCDPINTTSITVGTGDNPTPTPSTNTCTAPGTGQYVLGEQPTINGNTASFTITSGSAQVPIASSQNVVLHVINNPDTGQTAGIDSPVSGTSVAWTATAPGTYCAALTYLTAQISNAVPFTIGTITTGASNCPIVNNSWLDIVNNDAIKNSYYDSNIFTYNQGGDTFDFLYFSLFGCSSKNQRLNQISSINGKGALALSGRMVSSLYAAPPASGVTYFAQKIRDFNPVQPAYAQSFPGGIGYQALGPVQKIWVAFRNISYIGFIIVFVVLGFMIMFRAHISPQAVATVQDSIPRIVVALILVTFSYAIAGFMIDLMFLFLNIMINALTATGLLVKGDFIFQKNVFGLLWGDTWKQIFSTVATAINDIIQGSLKLPGGFLGDIAEKTIGLTGGTIAGLVVGIAILFIMFRVFLMLLMAYVMIIILTIFAPFFFLIQALPGNNGAKEWFKQMASNVAVFPVTALMFMLAGIIGGVSALGGQGQGIITPEKVGQFPLLTGGMEQVPRLIGIGFLLMTPSAAEMVKNALGAKGQGGAMGAFAPGAAALAGAGGFLGSRVAQSRVGRAYSDIMEHQGRAGAGRLTRYIVRGAAPADPAHPEYGISRGRLPH